MIEDEVYRKALNVLNDALDGNIVDPNAVSTATGMFALLWSTMYQERLRNQQTTDAKMKALAQKYGEKKDVK